MKSQTYINKIPESPLLSPAKIKLTTAITPTLGDSVLIRNFESQNEIKIQLSELKFEKKNENDSSSRNLDEFERPHLISKVKKMQSFESMKLPYEVNPDERRRKSNNYFSFEEECTNDVVSLKTKLLNHLNWKKQLRATFLQIERSLYSMMMNEAKRNTFSKLFDKLIGTVLSVHRTSTLSSLKSPLTLKMAPSINEKIPDNIVDVLIKRHIEFLGNQSHIFQTSQSWIKTIIHIISDFLQAILSLISCVLYILSTYVIEDSQNQSLLDVIHISDYVITALFSVDLVKQFLESKNKIKFFFKMHSIIDVLAILPIYLQLLFGTGQSALGFLHILQIFRIIRILRLYRLFKEYEIESSDKIDNSLNDSKFSFTKQLAIFLCSMFALLFISAGVSYELDGIFNSDTYTVTKIDENGNPQYFDDIYTFFYAFYLMFETIISLGYGDVVANSSSSRILICFLVFLFIFVLVDQIIKLHDVKSKTSRWDCEYKHQDHIVIIGMFNENSLLKILQELFKLEEERKIMYVLLIRNSPPSMEIINLMGNANYEGKVSYLQCNLLSETMISKSNIKKCREIFLVNESPSTFSYQHDKMLMALMNLYQECFPFTPKILRVSDPEIGKRFYGNLNHWSPWNKVFSTITLKKILMVENIFNKGFSTIFSNFFCSNRLLYMQKDLTNINWYMEYGANLLQEMFCVKISTFFHGMFFSHVVQILFKSKSSLNSEGLLLIGVKTKYSDEEYDTRTTILINPQNYLIRSEDLGIVIASNQERAEFLTFFDLEANDLKICNFTDEDQNFFIRKESIHKEFETTHLNNNSFTLGKFLSNEFLLWKEDISSKISGHIILFYSENIYESVIASLRAKTKKPIVYYSETKSDDRWSRLTSRFSNIFYVQGDIFDIMHLKNCGIQKAFHVCIFNPMSSSGNESNTPECLLLANLLDEYFTVPYTIEATDHNELKFLANKPKKFIEELGAQFYPKYMAGDSYILNVLDSLVSFSSSNPINIDVFIHMFIYNENRRHTAENEGEGEWETQNQNIHILENLQIKTIKCPEAYKNKCYQDLLVDFCCLNPSLIPIGMITERYSHKKKQRSSTIKKLNYNVSINFFQGQILDEEMNQNILPTPITLTNPLPTTLLNESDRIIVIGNFTEGFESLTPGVDNIEEKMNEEIKESLEDLKEIENEENNKRLLTLMNLTLSGKKKIIKKIEEKNQMIRNLMEEIEQKKQGYAKLMTFDKKKI